MGSFEEAQKKVAELVERFKLSPPANEASVRVQFLNPFFEALGWDVRNLAGHAEQYKEVVHEATVLVGAATKAPDYSFRVGGVCKFYVEAKNPSVSVKGDPHPAYQLRRYAWSAQLLLSILTDFEEFAVYDCYKKRPKSADKASKHRILYLTFGQYPEKLREIWDIFAKESILKGSFDRFAEKARGTAEVDAEFLKEIEAWRNVIARNLALRNRGLTIDQLNEAVQRVIDRIIFLRMAEDRGIEHHGRLLALINGPKIYARFGQLCQQADTKYNSGLFDFAADNWTLDLRIDDKVLKPIIKGIYYPDSPYEFSVIPPEILGNVYEQFLGKVIRLTKGHQARIEEKPEVKKAGGVYYTPRYIVDYIVQHTVGKLIEGKSPTQLKDLHVLDPACGSGSFLLGAYQCLLDHHLNWYVAHNPERRKKQVYRRSRGEWRLMTAERKRILTRHIYGVDIDLQAVEVSKLSLLLKVLEGESADTLSRQMKFFRERALPNLKDNIKCGNSLIGPDYLEGRLPGTIDPDELRRVNPFDWPAEFPHILGKRVPAKKRGFDAVIGNPPYGSLLSDAERRYVTETWQTTRRLKDMYVAFVESSCARLRRDGLLGYIIPSAWLGGPRYIDLRRFLLGNKIMTIVALPFDVFSEAYIDTLVMIASRTFPEDGHAVLTYCFRKREKLHAIRLGVSEYQTPLQADWGKIPDLKFVLDEGAILVSQKARQNSNRIWGQVVEMKRGVLPSADTLSSVMRGKNWHPYFEGSVYRYRTIVQAERFVQFGPKLRERPKDFSWFTGRRVLLRRLVSRARRLMASTISETAVTNKNLYVLRPTDQVISAEFILGLLNSRLISYLYLSQVSQARKDDFPQVTIKDILELPFPDTPGDRHNRVVELVERMLELHKQLHAAKTERDKELLQRQIDATDRQIDQLVHELYGLTDKEIRIVEEASNA